MVFVSSIVKTKYVIITTFQALLHIQCTCKYIGLYKPQNVSYDWKMAAFLMWTI